MTTSAGPLDERAGSATVAPDRHTVVGADELLRHPLRTRVTHWLVAIFFVLGLLSGMGIYTPWLYKWLTPLFGGGPMARFLHPWFGVGFVIAFAFEFFNWRGPMTWTAGDSRWMRRMKSYALNEEKLESPDVGFFNAGQKMYFWVILWSAAVFLLTGILMWFPEVFGRVLVAISYVLHDVAALAMLGSFIIHIYEGTAQQPGTFHSMTRGTVKRNWAWTHHPAWYRAATGRNPTEAYEADQKKPGKE
jgi:formate dehydrogenase subunit gamma